MLRHGGRGRAWPTVLGAGLDAGLDAGLELALGSACAGCVAPGRALCGGCEQALPRTASAAWPTPTPPGLVRPAAAGEYAGTLRSLVLAHKEHGRLALARPLGRVLAAAVVDAWLAAEAGRVLPVTGAPPVTPALVLVPVPSHPAVVRGRGHDPVLRTAQAAAAALRRDGLPARVVPVLRVVQRPQDQAGLDAAARMRNLQGRFAARAGTVHGTRGREVVLVDDVVTTGATLLEAQRALESVGASPIGAATVAATRRRVVLQRAVPPGAGGRGGGDTRGEPKRFTSVT